MSRNVEPPAAGVQMQSSPALTIPGSNDHLYWGLEIYRSWCCSSFCKDYPDLQLRGDLIGDKASESPVLDDVAPEGPLLQSKDLAEMGTLQVEPVAMGTHREGGPPPRQLTDSSIVLEGEPPSESMLDGYLENKQMEVYQQHLQDVLCHYSSSPSRCLLPPTLAPLTLTSPIPAPPTTAPPSILQLIQQLPVKESMLPLLSPTRSVASSNFSSPVLRISNADQRASSDQPGRPGPAPTSTKEACQHLKPC